MLWPVYLCASLTRLRMGGIRIGGFVRLCRCTSAYTMWFVCMCRILVGCVLVCVCEVCDCVPACVACLCGQAPSGPSESGGGERQSSPIQEPARYVFMEFLACQPPRTASPAQHDTLSSLPSSDLWHRRSPAPPARPPPSLGGVRVDMASISLLSKEWIIIPGQAASATNLREIIVE